MQKEGLNKLLTEECETLRELIAPHELDSWTIQESYATATKQLVRSLAQRFMHRASLFCANRVPKGKPLIMCESDFEFAWQTLETDAVN